MIVYELVITMSTEWAEFWSRLAVDCWLDWSLLNKGTPFRYCLLQVQNATRRWRSWDFFGKFTKEAISWILKIIKYLIFHHYSNYRRRIYRVMHFSWQSEIFSKRTVVEKNVLSKICFPWRGWIIGSFF